MVSRQLKHERQNATIAEAFKKKDKVLKERQAFEQKKEMVIEESIPVPVKKADDDKTLSDQKRQKIIEEARKRADARERRMAISR